MTQDRSTYDDVKCEVCGKPWADHTADCPRHDYRPWTLRARKLRQSWEARRAAELAEQNTPEVVP